MDHRSCNENIHLRNNLFIQLPGLVTIAALQFSYTLVEEDVDFAAFGGGQKINIVKLLRRFIYAFS